MVLITGAVNVNDRHGDENNLAVAWKNTEKIPYYNAIVTYSRLL